MKHIERCPSCWELYPIEKMITLRTGDQFQIYDRNPSSSDLKEKYIFNPVFMTFNICQECYARIENKL